MRSPDLFRRAREAQATREHAGSLTMTTIQIELPDATARAAREAGLLTPQALDRLLTDALKRQEAADSLPSIAERVAAAGIAPMSMEEINAEVKAARAECRQRGQVSRYAAIPTTIRCSRWRWLPRSSRSCRGIGTCFRSDPSRAFRSSRRLRPSSASAATRRYRRAESRANWPRSGAPSHMLGLGTHANDGSRSSSAQTKSPRSTPR